MKKYCLIPALVLFLVLTAASVFSEDAPEFGKTVSFAKDDPQITMGSLKGKVALIVFFQSW